DSAFRLLMGCCRRPHLPDDRGAQFLAGERRTGSSNRYTNAVCRLCVFVALVYASAARRHQPQANIAAGGKRSACPTTFVSTNFPHYASPFTPPLPLSVNLRFSRAPVSPEWRIAHPGTRQSFSGAGECRVPSALSSQQRSAMECDDRRYP